MRDAINQLDTTLFLWLNGLHAPWLDPVWVWITDRASWFPFYAGLVGWLIWRYRRRGFGVALTLGVAVLLSDQVSSSVLKPLFARPRPCHEPALQALIHPVLGCGGAYGFVSSHAANSFVLAMVLYLLLGREQPWVRWTFVWAFFVSYSRIYVGAHYPLDVLAGAGVGMLCARLSVWAYWKITRQPGHT